MECRNYPCFSRNDGSSWKKHVVPFIWGVIDKIDRIYLIYKFGTWIGSACGSSPTKNEFSHPGTHQNQGTWTLTETNLDTLRTLTWLQTIFFHYLYPKFDSIRKISTGHLLERDLYCREMRDHPLNDQV